MRSRRTNTRSRAAKLAAASLGVFACIGGAAFALVPSAGPPRVLEMRIAPATRVVDRGATATYAIRLRHADRRDVTLSIAGRLPRGVIASLRPRSTRGRRATLRIATPRAATGTHRIRVVARSGKRRAITAVTLVVRRKGPPARVSPRLPDLVSPSPEPEPKPMPPSVDTPQPTDFTISGDLGTPLTPGLTVPLDLELTNSGPVGITISDLTAGVDAIVSPRATVAYPCVPDDFAVTQFSGSYGFTLRPASTITLSQLGFPAEQWPQVTMPDRPVNQNGCKGATLRFAFTGRAGTS